MWLCCLVARLCLTFCNTVNCRVAVLQDCRLPSPPLSLRVCSNTCPLSQWCYPTISSSVAPFSFCPQSFPASGSLLNWFFTSGSRSIGALTSASVLPVNTGEISFRIDWFDLAVQGTLKNFLQHHSLKASILQCSAFFIVQLSHPYMTAWKTITTLTTLVMSLTSLSLGSPCPCEVGYVSYSQGGCKS